MPSAIRPMEPDLRGAAIVSAVPAALPGRTERGPLADRC
jgi:hypothetical protein